MTLYQVTVRFVADGLVHADTPQQARRIALAHLDRLYAERNGDEDDIAVTAHLSADFEPGYLCLNGDLTYREAQAAQRRIERIAEDAEWCRKYG